MKTIYKSILTILTLTLLGSTALSIPDWAKAKGSPVMVDTLYNILGNTQSEVDNLFESIIDAGESIPEEAQEKYDEAMEKWEESQELYDSEEYEEAADKATEALNLFGETIKESEYETEDEEEEEYLGLYTDLEKTRYRLVKLKEITDKLEKLDTKEIDDSLGLVEDLLDDAEAALDRKDYEGAREKLVEAKQILGPVIGMIHSLGSQKRMEKAEKFMEKAMERVEKMQGRVNNLLKNRGAKQGKMRGIGNMFNGIRVQLGHLIGRGHDIGYGDLLDELDELDEDLEDIFEDEPGLGKETHNQFKQMERHRLQIDRFWDKIQELEEQGYNVTELEDMLEEADSLHDEAHIKVESGDQEAAEEIIDEVEEILEELDDMIDDAEELLEDTD